MPMNPKGGFALVGERYRYAPALPSAGKWLIIKIGRETPHRIYLEEQRPPGFKHDPYWEAAMIVARFDTWEECSEFKAAGVKATKAAEDAVDLNQERQKACQVEAQILRKRRDMAITDFVTEAKREVI